MKLICAATLVFTFSIAPVAARDPACNSVRGSNKVLPTLGSCDLLYCGRSKEPTTPGAIKVMDDTLTKQRNELKELHNLLTSYEKVCAKLVKRFCENCPDFVEFQDLHLRINLKQHDLYVIEQDMKDFRSSLERINNIEGDLACFKQVKDLMGEGAPTKASMVSQFKRVQCRPNQ